MSSIPIVQGVAVSGEQSKYGGYQQAGVGSNAPSTAVGYGDNSNSGGGGGADDGRPQPNPKQYQDVVWGVLFIAHLIAMICIIGYGISARGGVSAEAYGPIIFMVSVAGLASLVLSTLTLSFMMNNTETLVQTALVFSVISSLVVGIIGFMVGSIMMGIIGLVAFAIGICYARIVWHRIPFAAANLVTALTAVRANMGLAVVGYGFTALAFAWTILWFLGLGDSFSGGSLAVVFVLFLSYYWVHQVLQNTVHVTTAGVIGTWWFVPDEASSCCSPALTDSLARATTYSFGSICFGSFLVALVQALRALEYYSRDSDDFQFLSCIIQCILGCLEGILEELNKWAYVYVGLYGFPYLQAGRNVINLFQQKGWTVIITDDLSDNVLFMMSIAVGLATGLVGLFVASMDRDMFAAMGFEHSGGPGFLIGFLTGFLIATVLMAVVGSAVNTVIVCFAEAPREFEQNHPALSARMRAAWTQAWPELGI